MNEEDSWWYELNGQQKGSIQETQIIDLIIKGEIKPENLVWKKGTEKWVMLKDSPLSEHINNDSPPPIVGEAINNTIVWWLAFAPLIGQILQGVFIGIFYPEPSIDNNSLESIDNYLNYLIHTDFNSFWFITLGLNFYLSFQDEKKLKEAGHDTIKLGSIFLVPVYLYKRAELLKQNNAYFWVWIIMFVLTIIK